MIVEGKYNTADVKVEEIEGEAMEQIQEMVNHEAFVGDDDITIMPDAHWGAGAVIGFTKPLGNRIVPGTVGVDIGCGMLAANFRRTRLGNVEELDQRIREEVPMGFDVHGDAVYHMHNDFPYSLCQHKLERFNESKHNDFHVETDYGPDYYDELLDRVGYDPSRAAQSVGTLGGGNHFIELGKGEKSGDLWCIIHSGSRGLGLSIAEYWMDRATELRNFDTMNHWLDDIVEEGYDDYVKFNPYSTPNHEILDWIHGSMGEDFVNYEALKADYRETEPERIGEIREELKTIVHQLQSTNRNEDLDYLEGEETHGYIRDMIFAQTYAEENRRIMAEGVATALGESFDYINDAVSSVHNYIDFDDSTIRKGACRAHQDKFVIIPFNIEYGTLICRGKGDPSWNNSAPHGAGRAMGRRDAERRFDEDDFDKQTEGVYTSKAPIDEIPGAYKDPGLIEEAIGPTVEIVDRVDPILNLKAD
jgi:RNA-splicing ligase RtcB